MNVRIRIPTNNHPDRELARWLIWAAREAERIRSEGKGYTYEISSIDVFYSVYGADRARTRLVEDFLASSDTHLWMNDDDTVPPQNLSLLNHIDQYPIVSGLYYGYHKDFGRFPHVYAKGKEGFIPNANPLLGGEGPFFADAVGLGCCVFAREVFEKAPPPWFSCTYDPKRGMIGDDISFFLAHPQKVRVIPSYRCQHIKDMAL